MSDAFFDQPIFVGATRMEGEIPRKRTRVEQTIPSAFAKQGRQECPPHFLAARIPVSAINHHGEVFSA